MTPERCKGLLIGDDRVKVEVGYIREQGINSAKSPALLANLLGSNLDSTVFWFRDVPEVWAELKAATPEQG
jgi:hypothetical protein